ncbi:MAG: hypothetical protein OXD48_11635 [Litoreibacter sp.]|nr:hypothetical protein [Litoreibacter sp.]
MRPYQHAMSSAKSRQSWTDDLPVHEFLDSTKFCCADRRHRFLLHHADLGSAVAERAFPQRSDIGRLVARHVKEDLGRSATYSDWLDRVDKNLLPRPSLRRLSAGEDHIAKLVSRKLPEDAYDSVLEVCAFLYLPSTFVDAELEHSLPVFMNAAGPMLVRRVFGPPCSLSDSVIVDFGWIAEAIIFTLFGRIPDLSEVVGAVIE